MTATDQIRAAIADRYVIERELGAGGMATVYLAQDVKHDRKVALKVLRPELAAVIGAERFLQEIKVTANLQHPHILPLFDSGAADSFLFYVMPYVEGETLRDRLTREKQLSVEEAVRIAREAADALDYAHRHGVVHRDIKPENILMHDGRVMVADFGIALAVSEAGAGRMTETGMSLGTPHYMSPEQAMGERNLDARSDVYALGAILYEMLVGEPPFTGPTAQAIVARVVTEHPRPLVPQRHTIPPHVEATVLQALEKLPADRWASAAEFNAALSGTAKTRVTANAMPAPAAPSLWTRVGPMLAVVAGVLLLVAVWGWFRSPIVATPSDPVQFTMTVPDESQPITQTVQSALAISPNGRVIVYVGNGDPETRLYRRNLDALDVTPIPNTEGADTPFFSPDGRWVGFRQGARIRKVDLVSGSAFTVATLEQSTLVVGAAWSTTDTIYVALEAVRGLFRVPSEGGSLARVPGADTTRLYWSEDLLPGEHWLLSTTSFASDSGEVYQVEALSLADGERRMIAPNMQWAMYARSGHVLMLTRDGTFARAPLDPDDPQVIGVRTPVAINPLGTGSGFPHLALSTNGTLVYLSGASATNTLVAVDRAGHETPLLTAIRAYSNPRVAPGGHTVVYAIRDGNAGHLWTTELRSGTTTRQTFTSDNLYPVWTPDGSAMAFTSRRSNIAGIWFKPVDGSGGERQLIEGAALRFPNSFSPDGRTLFYRETSPRTGMDLYALTLADSTVTPVLTTQFNENSPVISPDGHWLAYTSDQSGRYEVFVKSWPQGAAQWQVSLGGGAEPVWHPGGRELFYRAGRRLMSARLTLSPDGVQVARRDTLFSGNYLENVRWPEYDVFPDGTRFVFVRLGESHVRPVVIVNWFEELARQAAAQ